MATKKNTATKKRRVAIPAPSVNTDFPSVTAETLAQLAATLYGKDNASTVESAVDTAFHLFVSAQEYLTDNNLIEWYELTRDTMRSDKERAAHAIWKRFGIESIDAPNSLAWPDLAKRLYPESETPNEDLESLLANHHKDASITHFRENGCSYAEISLALNLREKEENTLKGQFLTRKRIEKQKNSSKAKKST